MARSKKAVAAEAGAGEVSQPKKLVVLISPPKLETVEYLLTGVTPYCQQAWSQKAIQQIKDQQLAGSQSGKGKKKDPKDFQACYEGAKHISTEGWCGIPAGAFRAAMISACRLVGFKMTLGKLSVFIEADGYDRVDGTPLIKIIKGEPKYVEHMVRVQQTVDLRARPMWDPGWEAILRVTRDCDQFSLTDVSNLLHRVGLQVGIGEGRPDSRSSCGMGWGLFRIEQAAAEQAKAA